VGNAPIDDMRGADAGVGTAHIIDGRVPHVLLIELLTDEGIGTMVKKEASW